MKNSTSKLNYTLQKALISTTGILVVLILWQNLAKNYHSLILPSPQETFRALEKLWRSGQLWSNTVITFRRTVLGYLAALAAGLFITLVFKASRFLQNLLRPIITVLQIIPPVIWVALAVLWFGIADDLTPVFLIFIVSFPIVFLNIFSGLESVDVRLVEMATVYRCSKAKILLAIYLPALIPHFVAALSLGLSFAWKSTIFAEFIGSSSGIGFAISMANANLETDQLFAWAIVLIVIMLGFEYGILTPLNKKVTRWKDHG